MFRNKVFQLKNMLLGFFPYPESDSGPWVNLLENYNATSLEIGAVTVETEENTSITMMPNIPIGAMELKGFIALLGEGGEVTVGGNFDPTKPIPFIPQMDADNMIGGPIGDWVLACKAGILIQAGANPIEFGGVGGDAGKKATEEQKFKMSDYILKGLTDTTQYGNYEVVEDSTTGLYKIQRKAG